MKRQTLSGGVVPAGVDELNTVASQQNARISKLEQGAKSTGANPATKVEPYGAFLVTYRPYKSGVIDTFIVSLNPDYEEIEIILEEYEDDGLGGITVKNTKDSHRIALDPEQVADAGGGVFTYEFDFPSKLEVNTNYGLIRTIGYIGGGKVKNPPSAPPDAGSRVIGDYLITINSTSGVVVVPQTSSPSNIAKNGNNVYSDDALPNQLRVWTTASGGASIGVTTSDDVYWDKNNTRVVIQMSNEGVQQGIGKQIRRGEILNVSLNVIGSDTFSAELNIDVHDSLGNSIVNTLGVVTVDLTTSSVRCNAPVQISNTASLTGNQRLFITSPTTLNNDGGAGTGFTIGTTDIMFSHGFDPQPYAPHKNDGGASGTDNFDVTPTGILSNADIGRDFKPYDFGDGGVIFTV